MGITIREASKRDIFSMALMTDDEWSKQINRVAQTLANYDSDIVRCYLAVVDKKVVGMVYGFILPNNVLIPELLYVIPSYRSQGIAHQLLSRFEADSCCSASMVFYHKSLHDFYEKLGYEAGEHLEIAMKEL